MYGGSSSGNSCLKALIARLKVNSYSTIDFNSCLFYKRTGNEIILFSGCINSFYVCSIKSAMMYSLFDKIMAKYDIKRPEIPKTYLFNATNCFGVTSKALAGMHEKDGSIPINWLRQIGLLLQ